MSKRYTPEERLVRAEIDREHAEWDLLCARAERAGLPGRYVTAIRHLPTFGRMLEWDLPRLSALRGCAALVVDAYEQDATRKEVTS